MSKYIEEFIYSLKLSDASEKAYRTDLRLCEKFCGKALEEISYTGMLKYINSYKGGTERRKRAVLNRFIAYCNKNEIEIQSRRLSTLCENSHTTFRYKNIEKKNFIQEILREVMRKYEETQNDSRKETYARDFCILTAVGVWGLDMETIINIKYKDFSSASSTLFYYLYGRKITKVLTKNEARMIVAYRKYCPKEPYCNDGYLFVSSRGNGQLNINNVQQNIRKNWLSKVDRTLYIYDLQKYAVLKFIEEGITFEHLVMFLPVTDNLLVQLAHVVRERADSIVTK